MHDAFNYRIVRPTYGMDTCDEREHNEKLLF